MDRLGENQVRAISDSAMLHIHPILMSVQGCS